jgi:hypothetical protein
MNVTNRAVSMTDCIRRIVGASAHGDRNRAAGMAARPGQLPASVRADVVEPGVGRVTWIVVAAVSQGERVGVTVDERRVDLLFEPELGTQVLARIVLVRPPSSATGHQLGAAGLNVTSRIKAFNNLSEWLLKTG